MTKKDGKIEVEAQGFKVCIDPEALYSIEYVEAAADAFNPASDDGTRLVATITLFRIMFGEQWSAVKAHFRSTEAISEFFKVVTEQVQILKN